MHGWAKVRQLVYTNIREGERGREREREKFLYITFFERKKKDLKNVGRGILVFVSLHWLMLCKYIISDKSVLGFYKYTLKKIY